MEKAAGSQSWREHMTETWESNLQQLHGYKIYPGLETACNQ